MESGLWFTREDRALFNANPHLNLLNPSPASKVEIVTKATESRRLLDTEVEQTEELLARKQAQVEREQGIEKEVKEINKVFLCELCNKQYTKVGVKAIQTRGNGFCQ